MCKMLPIGQTAPSSFIRRPCPHACIFCVYESQAYTRVDSDTVAAPQPAPAPGQAPLIMPLAGNASMPESVVYGSNPGSVASFASTSQGAAGASDGGGGGTSSSSDLSSAVAAANAATAASASAASGEQPPEAAPGKE